MDVRPFETVDCVDCQEQHDGEEMWWYKQQAYCSECYELYFKRPRSPQAQRIDLPDGVLDDSILSRVEAICQQLNCVGCDGKGLAEGWRRSSLTVAPIAVADRSLLASLPFQRIGRSLARSTSASLRAEQCLPVVAPSWSTCSRSGSWAQQKSTTA